MAKSSGGENQPEYTGQELALALLAVARDQGPVELEQALQSAGLDPGDYERTRRLLELARSQLNMLKTLAERGENPRRDLLAAFARVDK